MLQVNKNQEGVIMKTKNILINATISSLLLGGMAHAADLDSDSATVSLNVGQYAALTGLDDFTLTTTDPEGSANAVYSGSDNFSLESNTQVRVSLSGGDLSNGVDSVSTSYDLDGVGLIMDTAADSVHDAAHTVSASATLGAISGQKAGDYQSVITLTVSSI
jgi:hypothetical protein